MSLKVILFDLDNTLLDTHEVFVKKRDEMFSYIAPFIEQGMLSRIQQTYESLLAEAFTKFGVNPKTLWGYVFKGLEYEYPFLSQHLEKMQLIISSIYVQVPKLHEGAHDVLIHLKKESFQLGLVTHAEKPWTDFKLDSLGLRNYFDHIVICDVNTHKGPHVWAHAINQFSISPEEVLVIGDSVSGDIIASFEAGVRRHIWVQITQGWVVYKTGVLPEETKTVTSLHEIIPLLTNSLDL